MKKVTRWILSAMYILAGSFGLFLNMMTALTARLEGLPVWTLETICMEIMGTILLICGAYLTLDEEFI